MRILNIVIINLAVISALACSDSQKKPGNNSSVQSAPVSESQRTASLGEAPDFEKTALDGSNIRLSDYRNKVVLLNFWATWCGPCRREIPALIDLQKEFSEELVIIGVALDEEGFEIVRPYAEEMNINYPVVMDDYSYGEKLGGVFIWCPLPI